MSLRAFCLDSIHSCQSLELSVDPWLSQSQAPQHLERVISVADVFLHFCPTWLGKASVDMGCTRYCGLSGHVRGGHQMLYRGYIYMCCIYIILHIHVYVMVPTCYARILIQNPCLFGLPEILQVAHMTGQELLQRQSSCFSDSLHQCPSPREDPKRYDII